MMNQKIYELQKAAKCIESAIARFEENDFILDLGCSYGLLWRKNWERIPKGVNVLGVDIHGNWADDLYNYLEDNRETLPEGSDIQIFFSNLEKDETWEKIKEKKYSKIIAHYLLRRQADAEFEALLSENFDRIEKIALPGPLVFDSTDALFDRVQMKYPEGGKYLEDNRDAIEKYFETVLLKDSSVTVDMDSTFYHCYKSEG